MKTAFLFPGQGSQQPGMGADLYDNNNIYKQIFEECQFGADLDLKKACFEGEKLDESEVVQPAIFAHSMALLAVLRSYGYDADVFAGLSLGEYSALAAAGVFGIAECAALVRKRGRIMDSAFEKGICGMLSVIGFDIDKVSDGVQGFDNVFVANHLSQLNIVVSGYISELDKLQTVFTEQGAKMVTLLDVAGPYHTKLLQGASEEFGIVLSDEKINVMQRRVYSNVLGKPYPKDQDIKKLLCDQICNKVRWHDCTENMIAEGVTEFIEIGPGNVLSKLLKRRINDENVSVVSISSLKSLEKYLSGRES